MGYTNSRLDNMYNLKKHFFFFCKITLNDTYSLQHVILLPSVRFLSDKVD